MPTENPKISAYVPEVVYDRVRQFQEENNISSMSQAAIEIFAQYFGIDLNASNQQQSISSLPSRVGDLEKELSGLKDAYTLLVKRVDLIESAGRLLSDSVKIPVFETLESESIGGLDGEPQVVSELVATELNSSLIGEPPQPDNLEALTLESQDVDSSSLQDEPPKQLDLISSGEDLKDSHSSLLSRFKSNPLQGKILATRMATNQHQFNTLKTDLSINRKKMSSDEFRLWTKSKDPDGIEWIDIGGDRSKGYIPADNTPLDKLQSLSDYLSKLD